MMSKEYIDREALETELNHRLNFLMAKNGSYDHYTSGFDECVDKVENFHSIDAVEVVRCKDCKHLMFSDCYGECGKGYMGIVNPDGFCSYGERKEGAD